MKDDCSLETLSLVVSRVKTAERERRSDQRAQPGALWAGPRGLTLVREPDPGRIGGDKAERGKGGTVQRRTGRAGEGAGDRPADVGPGGVRGQKHSRERVSASPSREP